MTEDTDHLLTVLSARIRDFRSKKILGSGVLYYNESLEEKLYVITAAHILFFDSQNFKDPIEKIFIDIYNPQSNKYESLPSEVNFNFVSAHHENDIAILIIDKSLVFNITGPLKDVRLIKERYSSHNFILKGFPRATEGQEIVCLYPTWLQTLSNHQFQLQLNEDYKDYAINGFSGSGIFIFSNNKLFLYGVFTRYRREDKGKVIYCCYLEALNKLLTENFFPPLQYTFFSEGEITVEFFKREVLNAIKNLGPRYSEKLNYKLPIAELFDNLKGNGKYIKRFINVFDRWLIDRSITNRHEKNDIILNILDEIGKLRNEILNKISKINWNDKSKIDTENIELILKNINIQINDHINSFIKLRHEHQKYSPSDKKNYGYQPPYENEINSLHRIEENNQKLLDDLQEIEIDIYNNPCLIIKGDAGSGKSHLLGDIANESLKNKEPVLLLLGQLFKPQLNLWQNILTQLNLKITKELFLKSLNQIGSQLGIRITILIDAINEGAGKEIWSNELNGYISDISNYPHIGTVLTIRSSYFKSIITNNLSTGNILIIKSHEGFKGNEYAALKLFCEYYDIKEPGFPIFSSEFSNPLFLQLTFERLKATGSREFPLGYNSITDVFENHLTSVIEKLSYSKSEYRHRINKIKDALYDMARISYNQESTSAIQLDQIIQLIDSKYEKFPNLLDDLINENILTKNIHEDYKSGIESEVIYFSYERLGDFYIAEELLKPYKTHPDVIIAFKKGNELGELIKNTWRNRGILEVLSIILPERFQLEIFEVYNWALSEPEDGDYFDIEDSLNHILLETLKWRRIESINEEKLLLFFRGDSFKIPHETWLNAFLELTAIHNNPFNSDRLFKILNSYDMPKLDSFWQSFVRGYTTEDDYGNPFPLKRLLNWAWIDGISQKSDSDTIRLVAQTLSWLLSSTVREIRDQTTKALVNLLQEQPEVLIQILKKFKNIDDYYILERLYAVAYGCALRTSSKTGLQKISQFIFDNIFKNGNPPIHILLRDYARNIIEYAKYRKVKLTGELILIIPPYNSKLPNEIPSPNDIELLHIDYEDPDYKRKNFGMHNRIIFSVMEWDFSRYTIDGRFRQFAPISYKEEINYKQFVKELDVKNRKSIKIITLLIEMRFHLLNNENFPENKLTKYKIFNEQGINAELLNLKNNLSTKVYNKLINNIIPFIEEREKRKSKQYNFFDTEPFKRWIAKRVFDLGYNTELHGEYDEFADRFEHIRDNKIERIGKKYQWIALHEISAVIADNYKIQTEIWSENDNYELYQGPWQLYMRDIDPAFITLKNKILEFIEEQKNKWWLNIQYNHWNGSGYEWVQNQKDLPDPVKIISKMDPSNEEWLYLKLNLDIDEPKPLGKDKYHVGRKRIWYYFQSYLVHKKDKLKIAKWLKEKNFFGRWMPESYEACTDLINRENYWSLISKNTYDGKWQIIRDTNYKIMITTSEAVGEMSEDKSGAHFRYEMPNKKIFQEMKLIYSSIDGEFVNENGEFIVIHPNPHGILINKKAFLDYLNFNNLDIIWTLLGEKTSRKGDFDEDGEYLFKVISGVYYFNEVGKLSGEMHLKERND